MFNRTQRRPKRDQGGNTASKTPVSQAGVSPRATGRPFQDLRLRELLVGDDAAENQGNLGLAGTTVDTKRRDVKILPVLATTRRAPHGADPPETSKSPQWLMNPSPQQPQSTTLAADERPDSSSQKDAASSSSRRQVPCAKNKILIELLKQDDDDDDEDGETTEADPESSPPTTMSNDAEKQPGAVSVLKMLAKLDETHGYQQATVSALPDTSASPRDLERDVEPTSNSGSGSSNNLLKVSDPQQLSFIHSFIRQIVSL